MKFLKFSILFFFLLLPSLHIAGQNKLPHNLLKIAKQAPNCKYTDTYDIYEYLADNANNTRELIILFCYWIASNIDYDIKKMNSNDMSYTGINHTLETRKTMCQGYAELLCDLCDWADIDCEIVDGYAKGYGYNRGVISEVNHLWNAINIDGFWVLVDPTWASGYFKGKRRPVYVKEIRDEYIIANPEFLVLTHYPLNPMWQLISNPVSVEEFFSDRHYRKWKNYRLPRD